MGQRDCAPLKTYVQGSIILMKTQGRLCCLVNSHEKQNHPMSHLYSLSFLYFQLKTLAP